ncbi:AmmeMemoRadiSam system radical SAM enzyme [Candidatus Bathyarchaeota archaeon]|nr:AmmeMemoRadiSam system radical SAM enzyme [Candidatus Bathyarchaeota archaeon]
MLSRYQEKIDDNTTRCIICPRKCVIKPGQNGFCGTKSNRDGKIYNETYGILSSIAVDPIEKKPLAHFYPGSLSLSISSVGCSFTCPWCQNWHISMAKPPTGKTQRWPPDYIIDTAHTQECTSIAYTYNEPLINLEYVEDCAKIAKKEDIKNVLVTNGYVSLEALERFVDLIDAANVDWKGFSDEFYRKYCSADLQSVLNATIEMHRRGVHIEVTFLIIPNINDDPEETRKMAKFLVNEMGPDVPLHLSRFYPNYKFNNIPATPFNTLIKAKDIAKSEGVNYVYIGNVSEKGYEDTICPNCGKHVINRVGYEITGWNLNDKMNCLNCGKHIPITGEREIHNLLN